MYSAMNRVYKHYAIKVAASGRQVVPATKVMSFSSYPGYLSSLDDFLIMDRYNYVMYGTHIRNYISNFPQIILG
jgi:hypothetical protein